MIDFIDAHWFPLTSQGNIYSMTKLYSSNDYNKLLVASLKRKIYSCEYQKLNGYLRPMVKELVFTYIPSMYHVLVKMLWTMQILRLTLWFRFILLGGAEIISIDAYNKVDAGDGFVIGITIIKTSTDTTVERYLNIYTEGVTDGEGDESNSVEAVAQNCLMVELSYTPYHLYHIILPQRNSIDEVSNKYIEWMKKKNFWSDFTTKYHVLDGMVNIWQWL